MSVVINSNQSATLASMNLATSSAHLQRSLNRLSSGSKIVNPADDAGGLAVSMKLSAAAKRQSAALTNLGNSLSYLQTQDGVLKTTGKVLDRIGELKTLAADPTKNSTDIANYNAEFTSLQAQITSLAAEKFNGANLFGSSTLNVATTESGDSTIAFGGMALMGAAAFTDPLNDLSNWAGGSGSSASGGVLNPPTGGNGTISTSQSWTGAFEVRFEVKIDQAGDELAISASNGTQHIASLFEGVQFSAGVWSDVRVAFDGSGNAAVYVNGSSTAAATASGINTTTNIGFHGTSVTPVSIREFEVWDSSSNSDISNVTSAASLTALNLSTVTGAIQNLATHRATNGAQQSRLAFASEVLTTNKANLEAANSRITDVDVAAESTQMARYNILVQAGTAMLSQANQSAQSALRLIG